MRKKIAMRLRREAMRRGARIESVEFIREPGWRRKDCGFAVHAVHAGWNIDATGDDLLDAYRGLLECMDWAEEEGPPENERSVIIH